MPRKKRAEKAKREPAKRGRGRRGAKPSAPAPSKVGRAARLLRRKPAEVTQAPAVEARALGRFVRLSPQKARLVIDLIRGRMAGEALELLRFTPKRAARDIEKVLRSAIANAEQKSETLDVDRLYVKHAAVNEGPRWKRVRPAPYGRAYMYQRRTAHIEIAVAERTAAGPTAPPTPPTGTAAEATA